MKHEYWGKKRGYFCPTKGACLPGKRASNKKVEHKGGVGRAGKRDANAWRRGCPNVKRSV